MGQVSDCVASTAPRCPDRSHGPAGKSTLLRCLSGLHFHQPEQLQVLGQPCFHRTPASLTYLGAEWRSNPTVKADVGVQRMLDGSQGADNKPRLQELARLLSLKLDGALENLHCCTRSPPE